MSRSVETTVGILALVTTLISATVVVENRYARAADVRVQVREYYARSLKLRILELELKPASQFTAADRALLHHLRQELSEATD